MSLAPINDNAAPRRQAPAGSSLSSEVRAMRAAHKRALSAPMHGIPMTADPNFEQAERLQGARLELERRACQYAAWLGERDGKFTRPTRDYNAAYDDRTGTVHFAIFRRESACRRRRNSPLAGDAMYMAL